MTLTLDIPDELADRLVAALPEAERDRFAVAAIAEALAARQREDETRLAVALLADLDPELEPEREAAECRSIVEAELADIDTDRRLVTLEEARRQLEANAAMRQAANP